MDRPMNDYEEIPRTMIQKVSIGLGIFFLVAGFAGLVMPGLMGMHLSLAHNLIHLASGSVALWAGYGDSPRRAFNFSVSFGSFYGFLTIAGFAFGKPGFPGVGYMDADQNLLRVIPNALEFGTMDHIVHGLIAAVLIVSAVIYKRQENSIARAVVNEQARTFEPTLELNSESDLKDADLGVSDISQRLDHRNRSEFERRV